MLNLILHVPDAPHPIGQPVPVGIEVRNASDQPVWIIGILEGSEAGFRYPYYQPTITGPEPLPEPDQLLHFGNVAPLRLGDFHRLASGASFDHTQPVHGAHYHPIRAFRSFHLPAPGKYRLQLTLSTLSQDATEWLGVMETPDKDAILDRLADVPRLKIVSNVAEVEAP